jgi:hypothetical protein
LLGLPRFGGGGLLLGIALDVLPRIPGFNGLISGSGLAGVLPISANFQN